MKKYLVSAAALVLLVGLLGACTKQEEGTVGGGVIGGVAGAALTGGSAVGTGVGAVGGALIGNRLSQ